MVRRLLGAALCVAVVLGSTSLAGADAASPTVSDPVPGTPVLVGHTTFDLASVGYEQQELFLTGTASAYEPLEPLTPDGRWSVQPASTAGYTTRVVVNRPIDPADFNGTVVVEWFNVSGGADASPDWVHMHVELIRRGYAWVGVSAQAVGVNQLMCPSAPPLPPTCLGPGDPVRYASLQHPGDSYSYDIFSQAGQAILDDPRILGGLAPERLIAVGESQSATRLVTYINAVHPLVEVYDGFLVHSRGATGAPLSQPPQPSHPAPDLAFIRDDLIDPVLVFLAENDSGIRARQDDNELFRLWEVAGIAHFDQYGLEQGATDTGQRSTVADWFDSMRNPTNTPIPNFECELPINTGPQTFVIRAAISHLNRWIADGTPPPMAPRLQTVSLDPVAYEVDALGNVLGGIRTPAVDAPVARLNGLGQPAGGLGGFCRLFGVTEPLTDAQLQELYRNHGGFVSRWNQATQSALQAGFLVKEDAQHIKVVGAQSGVLK